MWASSTGRPGGWQPAGGRNREWRAKWPPTGGTAVSLLLLYNSSERPHEGTHPYAHWRKAVFLSTLSLPNCQEQWHTQTHTDSYRGKTFRLLPVFVSHVKESQPQEPPPHPLRWQWKQGVCLSHMWLQMQSTVGSHAAPPDPRSHLPLLPAVFPPQVPAHSAPPVPHAVAVAHLLCSCLLKL